MTRVKLNVLFSVTLFLCHFMPAPCLDLTTSGLCAGFHRRFNPHLKVIFCILDPCTLFCLNTIFKENYKTFTHNYFSPAGQIQTTTAVFLRREQDTRCVFTAGVTSWRIPSEQSSGHHELMLCLCASGDRAWERVIASRGRRTRELGSEGRWWQPVYRKSGQCITW